MKQLITLAIAAVLITGAAGCASKPAQAPAKVFCPACGYEFRPPLSGL